MIRLNPTSIRLRPADVKALQDELERRREAAASAANTSAAAATENQSKAKTKPANGHGRRDTRDATSSPGGPRRGAAAAACRHECAGADWVYLIL
ncbi:hypothetical protein CspeluHIS016_0306200 [Cutaneotrichosporon spelunceum]|uniref:Uncharacterized protein n=1 Tax=Cutaneotrichosporon spelunceum TaxID=1672016 RepID=A0AAD3YB79_9TREE|nr:hypothetical protein CspeluHIS016_0306200 [Cutaneotrichosporon spelunceum]